jgi:hypothetical protein
VRDIELYTTVLGIKSPWRLVDSQLDVAEQIGEVFMVHDGPSSATRRALTERRARETPGTT